MAAMVERKIELRSAGVGLEMAAEHTNHRVGLTIDRQRFADRRWIGAEEANPQGMTEHDHGLAAGRFSIAERPSVDHLCAEQWQVPSRDARAGQRLRVAGAGDG